MVNHAVVIALIEYSYPCVVKANVMHYGLLTMGIVLLFSCGMNPEEKVSLPFVDHQHVIIAHRGNHVEVPENTLAAFEEAIRCGADYVEVDVRATADGHLVTVHDATSTKMTGFDRKVEEMTWDELRTIPVIPVRLDDPQSYFRSEEHTSELQSRGHLV